MKINSARALANPVFLMVLLLLLPFLFVVAAGKYDMAGGDEAYQMQAAKELTLGNGYVSSLYTQPSDLAKKQYAFLDSWPAGYSLLLAQFDQVGLSLVTAVAVLKLLAILFGVYGWSVLLRQLPSRPVQLLGAVLLALHFPLWGNYTTAALAWALFGFSTVAVSCGMRSKKFGPFLVASALTAAAILLRYQSISIIPPLCLCCLWAFRNNPRSSLAKALLLMGPPVAAFLLVFLFNKANAQVGTFLDRREVGIFWEWRWLPDATISMLGGGTFRMDEIFWGLLPKLGNPGLVELFRYAAGGVMATVSGLLMVRAFRKDPENTIWLMLNVFSLLSMFFILAVTSNYESLSHGRYYHYFAPLLLYVLLLGLDLPKLFSRRTSMALVVAGGLMAFSGISAFSFHRYQLIKNYWAVSEAAIDRVRGLANAAGTERVFVVTDQYFPAFVLRTDWPVFMHTDPVLRMGFCATEPTLLVFVTNPKPPKIYFEQLIGVDRLMAGKGFERESFAGLNIVWKALGGSSTCADTAKL